MRSQQAAQMKALWEQLALHNPHMRLSSPGARLRPPASSLGALPRASFREGAGLSRSKRMFRAAACTHIHSTFIQPRFGLRGHVAGAAALLSARSPAGIVGGGGGNGHGGVGGGGNAAAVDSQAPEYEHCGVV